ncbi:MAG TPA: class I SAM-dependent methyltransferase [Nanoarchaeota archaeon]|nr:class I SAM-dependent methyltransferase [Nanoarchaeota archaeon]
MVEHYFSKKQGSELKIREIVATIRGIKVKLKLGSGTFSSKRVDSGSRLLAEAMQIGKNDSVLDLGCGTGIVGIVASHLTGNEVVLADVNERACMLAKENSGGLANITVLCGDMYEPVSGKNFDVIALNPPYTAGRSVCFKMIEEAKGHLNKGGSLQLVARHKKGGETLSRRMYGVFGNMQVIVKKSGYRVYMSVNN